jgi:hypothetical protein
MDIYDLEECKLEIVDMNTTLVTLTNRGSSQKLQLQCGTESATRWARHITTVINAAPKVVKDEA